MLNEVKERVYLFNKSLVESSLVIQNFGNVSERHDDKLVIKPSGINLNLYTYEDMSVIDIKSGKNLSKLKPSVDEPTHRILYQNFEEVNSIVHTHSNFATSFAQAKKPILNYGTTHSDFTKFSIPCTEPISERRLNEGYEENTGKLIIKTLEKLKLTPLDIPGILVANHGVFSWGENIESAVKNAEAIEYIANLAFNTILINPNINPIDTYISELHHERKHGLESYYGQE
tara:strand:- start:133 stop:822 length:690 start_codon:yes stop_codon:yes gene_type:complete